MLRDNQHGKEDVEITWMVHISSNSIFMG